LSLQILFKIKLRMSTLLTLFLIISMISFQITNAYNPYKYGPIGWAVSFFKLIFLDKEIEYL